MKVSESPYLSEMALIGVVKRGQRPLDFRGGSVTAVIGGVELDLRKANLDRAPPTSTSSPSGEASRSRCRRGGRVDARVVAVDGRLREQGGLRRRPRAAPRLVVRGHAIMGAVVIGH